MSDLTPSLPLSGFRRSWNGLDICEHYSGELVSLALALGHEKDFQKIFQSHFKHAPPAPGKFIQLPTSRILWSAADKYMVRLEGVNIYADKHLTDVFGQTVYASLQSDAWACIQIAGTSIYDVLERFITLDLRSPEVGFTARTQAHHMAVIVMKTAPNTFELFTPRSSALSFLTALERIADNVCASVAALTS